MIASFMRGCHWVYTRDEIPEDMMMEGMKIERRNYNQEKPNQHHISSAMAPVQSMQLVS